eukprot:6719673-Heterocapsa_arctica.AAC.1
MEVIVEHDQIGQVCDKFSTADQLSKNLDQCCGAAKKSGCLMCKAVTETQAMDKYSMTKTETKGIENFLNEQKEKRRWEEANNNQKLLMIYSALATMKEER